MRKFILLYFIFSINLLFEANSQILCNDECYWIRTGNYVLPGQFLGCLDSTDYTSVFTSSVERLRITPQGKVFVAGALKFNKPRYPHDDAMLTVYKSPTLCGYVSAQEIEIIDSSYWDWPDFVFEKSYNLLSLYEIEEYISLNKHLPDIPTSKEIDNSGLDLFDINKLTLQKIEELTIHLINLKKQQSALKSKIKTFDKNQINANRRKI